MKKAIMAAGALMVGTMAEANPSVFVRSEPGFAWWLRQMEGRVLGKSAGPVSAEDLSTYLEETMLYSPYRVCSLEPIQEDTFVGIDREAQSEIDATQADVSWQMEAATPDSRRVLGQSVVFEGCDQEDPRGAALLVTDNATGEILRWQPLGQVSDGTRSYPVWVLFLYPRNDDELFSYSGCTECGDRTNVYYDVTRKRIYTEHNGH